VVDARLRGHWNRLVAIESRSRRVLDLARVLSHLPGGWPGPKSKVFASASWA
jgi:hypothetical protein